MSKDISIVLSGDASRAEAELRKLQSTGKTVTDRLSGDFEALGIRSTMSIQQEQVAITAAFDRIKASGVASAEEIGRAQIAMEKKLDSLTKQRPKPEATKYYGALPQETAAVAAGVKGLERNFGDLQRIAATIGMGVMVTDLVRARMELDKITNSLNVTAGSKSQGADNLRFVREESDRLGLSLQASAADFGRLGSSVRGTVLEGAGAREMFTGITEGLNALQLSAEQQNSIWAQITQGINKGNLELEDLKIMAEAGIPVFRLLADAMGKTQPEIMKMITNGELLATSVYPKLAASMHKAYGADAAEAARTTQGELNKLTTALFNLKTQAASGETIPTVIRTLASGTKLASENIEMVTAGLIAMGGSLVVSGITAVAGTVAGLAALTGIATAGLVGIAGAASFSLGTNIARLFDIGGINEYEYEMKRAEESTKTYNAAMSKKTAAANLLKASQEINLKQQEKLTTAFEAYEKTIISVGKTELEYAKSAYSADLARQPERVQSGNTANLIAPLQSYLAVVDQVYGTQLKMELAIGQALFQIGAEQKKIAAQSVNIYEVEKNAAAARLDTWQQYYGSLKTMHGSTMEQMKKQQADLFQIRSTTADLSQQVAAKLLSPMEKYYADQAALEQKQQLAASLGSEEKITMLQSVQQAWANLATEVKSGDVTVVTTAAAVATSLDKIKSIGVQLEQEKAAQITSTAGTLDTITAAMKAAADQVEEHRLKVVALDNSILALNRSFALTIDDKATPIVDKVRVGLDMIRSKEITITAHYVSSYSDSGNSIPSYDVGTPYVPRTGLALIHQGERIVTAKDNAKGNTGGSGGITIGDVIFNIPNVTNGSTADELVNQAFPKLAAKLDEYQRRKRAA